MEKPAFPDITDFAKPVASYSYAALLDADGNEQPITEHMIRCACEAAMESLYAFMPPLQGLAELSHSQTSP